MCINWNAFLFVVPEMGGGPLIAIDITWLVLHLRVWAISLSTPTTSVKQLALIVKSGDRRRDSSIAATCFAGIEDSKVTLLDPPTSCLHCYNAQNNVLHGFLWDDLFEGKLPISLQLRGNKLLTFPKGPSFKETLLLFLLRMSLLCAFENAMTGWKIWTLC